MKAQLISYDGLLKDLFQRDRPTLLNQLTGGVAIKEFLNVELPKVQERRADLVAWLRNRSIFHLEIQSTNDRNMPYREGIYCSLLGQNYRCPVRQVVLYVGEARMRMRDHVDLGQTLLRYTLVDIREFQAQDLMSHSQDLPLALLAKGGVERVREIAQLAAGLERPARDRVLTQLALAAGLRRLTGRIKMELNNMGVTVDLAKNEFVAELVERGREEGRADVLLKVLVGRFGTVPRWAAQRVAQATPAQLDRWVEKVISASTLEGVLGPR